MSGFTFAPATQEQGRLRLALIGPSGSGKTYTALRLATAMGERVALIDTERGSASKYARLFHFDVLQLTQFDPRKYVEAIHAAETAGYDVVVIDSLSHAWMGAGGALELVDQAQKRSQSGNSFAAWRDVTPLHNQLVNAMLGCECHLIATMRAKTEYVQEKDERGRTVIRKVGLAPVQRDGLEYEFDVVGDMDQDNNLIVTKTRCPELQGAVVAKPGEPLAATLRGWLGQGDGPTVKPEERAAIAAAKLNTPIESVAQQVTLTDAEHREIEAEPAPDVDPATLALAFVMAPDKEPAQPRETPAEKSARRKEMETRMRQRMAEAEVLGIDLTPYEFDDTVGDGGLEARGVKLAAAIKAKTPEPAKT